MSSRYIIKSTKIQGLLVILDSSEWESIPSKIRASYLLFLARLNKKSLAAPLVKGLIVKVCVDACR